jgi:hypothetical protein
MPRCRNRRFGHMWGRRNPPFSWGSTCCCQWASFMRRCLHWRCDCSIGRGSLRRYVHDSEYEYEDLQWCRKCFCKGDATCTGTDNGHSCRHRQYRRLYWDRIMQECTYLRQRRLFWYQFMLGNLQTARRGANHGNSFYDGFL